MLRALSARRLHSTVPPARAGPFHRMAPTAAAPPKAVHPHPDVAEVLITAEAIAERIAVLGRCASRPGAAPPIAAPPISARGAHDAHAPRPRRTISEEYADKRPIFVVVRRAAAPWPRRFRTAAARRSPAAPRPTDAQGCGDVCLRPPPRRRPRPRGPRGRVCARLELRRGDGVERRRRARGVDAGRGRACGAARDRGARRGRGLGFIAALARTASPVLCASGSPRGCGQQMPVAPAPHAGRPTASVAQIAGAGGLTPAGAKPGLFLRMPAAPLGPHLLNGGHSLPRLATQT
jgi:hypothetical protein